MNIYKEIRPKKIVDHVFDQIQDLIYMGQLKPGEQLLPERELADSLGVSRNSVREAINKLIDRKLIENRQGLGTFVCKPQLGQHNNPLSSVINDDISTLELLEFRIGLECNAAVLAARRATSEDIAHLNTVMDEMRRMVKTGSMGYEQDVRFHMGIAYATKNRVHVHMMKHFYDLLYYGIWKSHMFLYQEKPNLEAILTQHGNILESLRNHDTTLAYDLMREHITHVMEYLAAQ